MSCNTTSLSGEINRTKPNKRSRGQALVELAILAPWIFFLFVYAVNTGFCVVAAIGVQNAARAAALYISSSSVSASAACGVVTNELQLLPNYSSGTSCSSASLQVTASQTSTQSIVTVTYQTSAVIPFPLLFSGPSTITRTATFPLRSS